MKRTDFNRKIRDFYRKHRRSFPWRRTREPYKILVSEVMLQQTQTARVVKFYGKFLRQFPHLRALAGASAREVLTAWQGLGYNRRALHLRSAAQVIVGRYGGKMPRTPSELAELPGIGKNTAGAICAYAFNAPVPFVETNIRKTFIHFFFRDAKRKIKDAEILERVAKTIDGKNPRLWYFAVVDYGAHLGKTVRGMNARSAHYVRQAPFEGSNRQIRSKLLRLFLKKKKLTARELAKAGFAKGRLRKNIAHFLREGLIVKENKSFVLAG